MTAPMERSPAASTRRAPKPVTSRWATFDMIATVTAIDANATPLSAAE